MAVTDLPQPDSPTRPTVSPGKMSRDTSVTAREGPRSVSKPMLRCSMRRSGVMERFQ